MSEHFNRGRFACPGTRRPAPALAIAAVVAGLGSVASVGRASPIQVKPGATAGVFDVISVDLLPVTATGPTATHVAGVAKAASPFVPANQYTLDYSGHLDAVAGFTTSTGGSYTADQLASVLIRRSTGAYTDMVWYRGTSSGPGGGTGNGSTLQLDGPQLDGGYVQVFSENAINVGGDNLFSTRASGAGSNPVGNNTDVDRVDLVLSHGVAASSRLAFVVSDRGVTGNHDAFDVAAITGVDVNGNPTSYGPLLSFAHGSWGNTGLTPTATEFIVRKDDSSAGNPLHPSDYVPQTVGGVSITTAALAGNSGATTIYGYSLFGANLTVTGDGSGTQLVDYTNGTVYGINDHVETAGGLDPAAFIAQLYTTTAVPEPTTAALAATAVSGLLLGRRRRTAGGAS